MSRRSAIESAGIEVVRKQAHAVPNYDQCTGELRGGFESAVSSSSSSSSSSSHPPRGRYHPRVPSGSWGFPAIAGHCGHLSLQSETPWKELRLSQLMGELTGHTRYEANSLGRRVAGGPIVRANFDRVGGFRRVAGSLAELAGLAGGFSVRFASFGLT